MFRVLPQCLRPEMPLPSVLLTVELLSLLVDHEKLAPQLCSHSGKAGQGVGGTRPDSLGWLEGREVAGTGQAPPEASRSLYLRRWMGGRSLSASWGLPSRRLPPAAVHVHHVKA